MLITRGQNIFFTNPGIQAWSKIRHDLSNKGDLKLNLPKTHFNKKCAPKLLFFIENKMRKVWMIFQIENTLRKSNFGIWDLQKNALSSGYQILHIILYMKKKMKLHNPSYHTGFSMYMVPLKNDSSLSQTQNLQLQCLYALNIHLMKVLSLRFFTERLYKASTILMQ